MPFEASGNLSYSVASLEALAEDGHSRASMGYSLVLDNLPTWTGDSVSLPHQHAETVMKSSDKWLRTGQVKSLNLARDEETLVMRHEANINEHLEKCLHLSLVVDASRLGGRDLMLGMLLGTAVGCAEARSCGAPPQVGQ